MSALCQTLHFKNLYLRMTLTGNSLAVQGLGLSAFTAVDWGSIPGQGTKIPQSAWRGKKKKERKKTLTKGTFLMLNTKV